jgi:LysM repeat protein
MTAKGIRPSQSWPCADLRGVSIILSLYVKDIGEGLGATLCRTHKDSNIERRPYYLPLFAIGFESAVHPLFVGVRPAFNSCGTGVTIAAYAHRVFTTNTFLARLRPKEYRKVLESVLNDTLEDIHDLVQYTVVETQKIVPGEHLDKTFAVRQQIIPLNETQDHVTDVFVMHAAFSLTVLYWLVKLVSSFTIIVFGLTTIYTLPVIASSQSRQVMNAAKIRAEELTDAEVGNTDTLVENSKQKATQLTDRARDTALQTKQRLGHLEHDGSEAASSIATQVTEKASDVTGDAVENARKLPDVGNDVINQASEFTGSTASSAKQRIHSGLHGSPGANTDTASATPHASAILGRQSECTVDSTKAIPEGIANAASSSATKAYQISSTAFVTAKQMGSSGDHDDENYALEGNSKRLRNTVGSTPRKASGSTVEPFADTVTKYASAGAQAATHGISDSSRGPALAQADKLEYGKKRGDI